jgi:hypothetical protein
MTTAGDRVKTVAAFGFTEREAHFLVLVMRHAGICVPRQYAAFAGTAYGRRVNELFDRLVERGYATICGCLHNRARLYHVRHHALYHAIGEPHSRYRRPVPAACISDRLMLLDGMLTSPNTTWLATAPEKAHGLMTLWPSIPPEALPHMTVGDGPSRTVRLFPNRLPVGIDAAGRVVFPYLVASAVTDDVRAFLQRHGDLLRALPEWTVRLLFFKRVGALGAAFREAFRAELASPLSPTVLGELLWYFEQCRLAARDRTRLPSDARFRRIEQAFDASRYRVLYRWLEDGDTALDVVGSGAIAEKLERGAGRLECVVLPHSYRHLTPLVSCEVRDSKAFPSGSRLGDQREFVDNGRDIGRSPVPMGQPRPMADSEP